MNQIQFNQIYFLSNILAVKVSMMNTCSRSPFISSYNRKTKSNFVKLTNWRPISTFAHKIQLCQGILYTSIHTCTYSVSCYIEGYTSIIATECDRAYYILIFFVGCDEISEWFRHYLLRFFIYLTIYLQDNSYFLYNFPRRILKKFLSLKIIWFLLLLFKFDQLLVN